MPTLSLAAVRQQLRAGTLDPIYLVLGEDEVEKASLAAEFTEVIDPELRAFNVERLYGGEAKSTALGVAALLDAARTLPLMAPRRIVLVLHTERLLVPKRDSKEGDQALQTLEAFIKAPEPHATVVFVADSLDGRRNLTRLLMQRATVVVCGNLDDVGADRWVADRVSRWGFRIEPKALRLLVERAGTDFDRLRADTERVCLYALGEPAITAAHVIEVVGPSAAQGDFALNNAMQRGAVGAALRELSLVLAEGTVPYMVLGQLRSFVERSVPAGGLASAMEAVLRTDLALKTSAGDHRVLLERLVIELCDERLRARVVLPGLLF